MASTSGDAPINRRLGIFIVLPAFISAMNLQNFASVLSDIFSVHA